MKTPFLVILLFTLWSGATLSQEHLYEYVIEVVSEDGEIISLSERGQVEIDFSKTGTDSYRIQINNYATHKKQLIQCEVLNNKGIRSFKTEDGTIITTTISPNKIAHGLGGSILLKTENGIKEYVLNAYNPHTIDFKGRYQTELPTEENIYVEGKIKELKNYEQKYGKLISSSRSGQHWVKTYKRKGKYYTVYSSGVVEQY